MNKIYVLVGAIALIVGVLPLLKKYNVIGFDIIPEFILPWILAVAGLILLVAGLAAKRYGYGY